MALHMSGGDARPAACCLARARPLRRCNVVLLSREVGRARAPCLQDAGLAAAAACRHPRLPPLSPPSPPRPGPGLQPCLRLCPLQLHW